MIRKSLPQSMRSGASNKSVASISTIRTVDREHLRDKARQMQRHENLRLAMCVRLQQKLRKSPKVAEEMASEILKVLKQRKLSAADLSDAALIEIVSDLSTRRHEQMSLAGRSKAPQDNQEDMSMQESKSGRQSSKSKERVKVSSIRGAKSGCRSRGTSTRTTIDDDRYLTEAQLQQKSVGFSLPPRVSPKKDRDNGIWEKIVKFSSIEEQMEAQRVKERKLRERREYLSDLDAQVAHKRHVTQQERQRSADFHRQTLEKIRQAEDEEYRKEQERLNCERQLIVVQTQQRLAKQQQMEHERAIKKAQEHQAAEILERRRKDDLACEKARKEAEKRRVEQVFLDNEIQLEQKRQQQARERELDVKLAEDYVAMEKKKEEARRQQLETMAENIQKKMKIFDDTAKASNDAKAREDDARVQRYQHELARKQAEEERKRQFEAEARSLAQQEYLRLQMQEKKVRDEAFKRDLNEQTALWQQERKEAERRENLVKQQRAAWNQSQRDVLLQQMRERDQRSLEADQTSLEVQLNSRLLQKIHQQAGTAQSQAEDVVSETQMRSRELQEQEEALHDRQSQRARKF